MTTVSTFESDLGKAIGIWRTGRSIPLPLIQALNEQGYDVATLARHHLGANRRSAA